MAWRAIAQGIVCQLAERVILPQHARPTCVQRLSAAHRERHINRRYPAPAGAGVIANANGSSELVAKTETDSVTPSVSDLLLHLRLGAHGPVRQEPIAPEQCEVARVGAR